MTLEPVLHRYISSPVKVLPQEFPQQCQARSPTMCLESTYTIAEFANQMSCLDAKNYFSVLFL